MMLIKGNASELHPEAFSNHQIFKFSNQKNYILSGISIPSKIKVCEIQFAVC